MEMTEQDVAPSPRSHERTLHRLEAVGALVAAVGVFYWAHPNWSLPISSGLFIFTLSMVAVGKWFGLGWVNRWRINLWFLAMMAWVLEMNIPGMPPSLRLLSFSVILGCAGTWSHRQWRQRAASPPQPRDDAPEPSSWEDPWDGSHSPAQPSFAWARTLRPRSRTALLHASAWVLVGFGVVQLFRELDEESWGLILSIPHFVLAAGLWFHQNWIRWLGMVICASWASAMVGCAYLLGFEQHLALFGVCAFTFVRIGLTFRRWYWEHSIESRLRLSEPER